MGPISRFFAEDHRRLENLLHRASAGAGEINLELYAQFRAGLLKHISLEEKILIPAAEKLKGARLPVAERIRLDHGALAALMVPPPSEGILAAVRDILQKHNVIEEEKGGLYDVCDTLAGGDSEKILARVSEIKEVPLLPFNPDPRVLNATRRALARAGYNLDDFLKQP